MGTSTDRERLERILRGQQAFMDHVQEVLEQEQKQDDILRAVVLSSSKERWAEIDGLEPDRVFRTEDIRALCVRYRLRFLDAGLFKGELPLQAVHALRTLERRSVAPLTSFKIMAPAERFRLCDSEVDPLLFVPVGADNYYLVHRWGTDLEWHRALSGWPLRSPIHLAATVLLIAFVLSALVPSVFLAQLSIPRSILFLWTGAVCTGFTAFAWFAFSGQFSTQAWNSRHFN